MSKIIRKTKHISLFERDKISNFLVFNGFLENIDFLFEASNEKDRLILILNNIKFTNKIFEVYEQIEVKTFLIRLAKHRWQSYYDICEVFTGTIKEFNKYFNDNFDLNIYTINHTN